MDFAMLAETVREGEDMALRTVSFSTSLEFPRRPFVTP